MLTIKNSNLKSSFCHQLQCSSCIINFLELSYIAKHTNEMPCNNVPLLFFSSVDKKSESACIRGATSTASRKTMTWLSQLLVEWHIFCHWHAFPVSIFIWHSSLVFSHLINKTFILYWGPHYSSMKVILNNFMCKYPFPNRVHNVCGNRLVCKILKQSQWSGDRFAQMWLWDNLVLSSFVVCLVSTRWHPNRLRTNGG